VTLASQLLEAASEFNGYTAKDGIRAVRATIALGLKAKRDGDSDGA